MLGRAEEGAALRTQPWAFVLGPQVSPTQHIRVCHGVSRRPEGLDRGLGMKGLLHTQAGQCIRGVARSDGARGIS